MILAIWLALSSAINLLITWRAKLLNADWSMKRVAWRQLVLSISCLSVTMASRFEIVDEKYIEELKDRSENEKKNSTGWWKNVFQKWAN